MEYGVLIVDDCAIVAESVAALLQSVQIETIIATTAVEARDLVAGSIRLALIDDWLSDEPGNSVGRQLREEHGLGIVMMTGRVMPSPQERGDTVWLEKPFDCRALGDACLAALAEVEDAEPLMEQFRRLRSVSARFG